MDFYILEKSVTGYKNLIKNKQSQDYLKVEKISNGLICTIADGHSGDYFINSYKGAKFACEAAIEIFKKYTNTEIDKIEVLMKKKVIQKEICDKWKLLVGNDMRENMSKAYKYDYFKYGTTLLAVLIKDNYILCLKLGDGDILLKKNQEVIKVLPNYKKNIVDCMAEENSFEKIIYKIEKNQNNISDIIIFSDGFENSFVNFDSMIKDINNTILKYNKTIFSRYILENKYDKYLRKLSDNNSFDDISIVFVNIL